MKSQVARCVEQVGRSVIVYDDTQVSHMREELFDASFWSERSEVASGGRGQALFVRHDDSDWVLRHYFRGGLIGRFLSDEYFWLGGARTRSFSEWDLLARLRQLELPVPQPVAARYIRRGLIYTADLITVRIPDVVPLPERLGHGPIESRLWQQIGALIGRFHLASVNHADLNAYNIQVDSADNFYLLDFDRGRLMPGGGAWTGGNLRRLERSLRKLSRAGGMEFGNKDWTELLTGYRQAVES
jgi:3-deoxy-D-manno-octulosonic acid kinase